MQVYCITTSSTDIRCELCCYTPKEQSKQDASKLDAVLDDNEPHHGMMAAATVPELRTAASVGSSSTIIHRSCCSCYIQALLLHPQCQACVNVVVSSVLCYAGCFTLPFLVLVLLLLTYPVLLLRLLAGLGWCPV
jgi:hypothetical protein